MTSARRSLGGGDGEPLAQLAVARVDAQLPSALGIDEPQLADVGELLLARIAHLDREHGVPAGEAQERRPPVERPAKVGDDDDQRALARDAVGQLERVAAASRCRAGGSSRSSRSVSISATPALARPLDRDSAPNATSPSRLPRRVAA